MFQFPSNGKGRGKADQKKLDELYTAGFNSLQTGRYMESFNPGSEYGFEMTVFQFPSNGKVQGKGKVGRVVHRCPTVSIPFKREGTWKVF